MKKTIYIAGTIPTRRKELNSHLKENKYLIAFLKGRNFKVLDPCRGRGLNRHNVYLLDKKLNADTIVKRDLKDIEKSDVMIARMYDSPSIGTSIELFYMSKILNRPVFVVTRNDYIKHHPWIKKFATKIFDDVDDALFYIVEKK